jgi:hypothetical protein
VEGPYFPVIRYPKTPRLAKLMGSEEMLAWNKLMAVVEEKVDGLRKALGDRYVAFGEWVYAKHRVCGSWVG